MTQLRIASTIECTESEGIGSRFGIWVQGCSFKCKNCCNPHIWTTEGGKLIEVDDLLEKILLAKKKYPQITGITWVGGEPLEQSEGVAELSRKIQQNKLSVMVFTGFLYENLIKMKNPALPFIDVLVDGLYMDELRITNRRFIGSSNQKVYFLTDFYSASDPRWAEANTAEIVMNDAGQIQVVGFPFDSVMNAFKPLVLKMPKD